MNRFYIENNFSSNKLLIQNIDLIHQIISVLRSKVGDNFVFFNGNDIFDRVFILDKIDKKYLEFSFKEKLKKEEETNFITLFQGLPNKMEKIEYIIQKGTEVGISCFNFFRSDRSQKLDINDKKIERLKKIIIESVEQSGRIVIPKINFLKEIDFSGIDSEKTIFFHTLGYNSSNIKSINPQIVKNIFVGPEGGWSDSEVDFFTKKSFKKIYLGNNILRCETVSSVVGFYFLHN